VIALAAALTFARRVPKMLSPKGWAVVAVLVLFLGFGAYCSHRAAQGERDRQAAERDETERKASTARETASTERAIDTATITAREKEWNHDAEQTPDSPPDDRTLRRRCRQLWDSGQRDVAACRGLARPAQAGSAG